MAPAFVSAPIQPPTRRPLAGRAVCPASRAPAHAAAAAARRARWAMTAAAADASAADTTDDEDAWLGAKHYSTSARPLPEVMSVEDVMGILPHRYPFLLVDRVLAFESGVRAVAVKSVSVNEPFFPGHFPDKPIMPGVLQVEAMAQVGGIVMLHKYAPDGNRDFFFGGVDRVKWRKPVVPGDMLVMEMTLKTFREKFGVAKMEGKGYVDGKVAVEGEFTLVMMPEKE